MLWLRAAHRIDAHQVNEARRQLALRVSGFDVPRPVQSFEQCHFDHVLTAAIKRAGFSKPTAIQAQALPAALSGRDVLVRRHAAGSPAEEPVLATCCCASHMVNNVRALTCPLRRVWRRPGLARLQPSSCPC